MLIDELLPEQQARIKALVKSVEEHLNGDIDEFMAFLEQANETKKKLREEDKLKEKKEKDLAKEKATKLGKAYVSTLKEGDMITFLYGPANYQRQATLPIEKIGAASVMVIYPKEMLSTTSRTPKRNILYSKIIVPENFKTAVA
jgi:hypothetical protein